jgi:hypothetical protein
MTQYLFSVIHDYVDNPPSTDPQENAEMFAKVGAFNDSVRDRIVFMGGLHAPESAARVAIADGKPVVTDGPHIDTKEIIGGLWIMECTDREDAVALAARATAACGVPVEIRPFHDV